jgi:hypothetical protein
MAVRRAREMHECSNWALDLLNDLNSLEDAILGRAPGGHQERPGNWPVTPPCGTAGAQLLATIGFRTNFDDGAWIH